MRLNTAKCGCLYSGGVQLCPLHAAAPLMAEALRDAMEVIERLYDHLKAKAGDVDLTYALRTVNRSRAALRAAGVEP